MFFFMLEKEDLDDLLRITIPSTAKTAYDSTKNSRVAVILLAKAERDVLRFPIQLQN
jgi:hypothetical protein